MHRSHPRSGTSFQCYIRVYAPVAVTLDLLLSRRLATYGGILTKTDEIRP